MKCVTCSCTDCNLLKLQTFVDNKTLNEISLVLPNFAIPEAQGPVYVCVICQDQIASFYKIKKRSLENCAHLKLYKNILKATSDVKFNELKIIIDINVVAPKREHDIKLEAIENCNELFSSEDEDQFHERDCNSTTNNEELNTHASEKRFKCSTCAKAFSKPSFLKAHIRVHTGERPYKCPTCHKSFTDSSVLRRHNLIHTGEKPHECDVCQKTFTQKINLISHKRCHSHERPYSCTVCSKTFPRSDNLRRHMRIHSGERPYECHLCEYKCTHAGDLKRHIRIHTGEKPYNCKLCQKLFTYSSSLRAHNRKCNKVINKDSD